MEYEKNGKNKTKSATTYLKIGDDPYQAVEGGFVDNKGISPVALDLFMFSPLAPLGLIDISRPHMTFLVSFSFQ